MCCSQVNDLLRHFHPDRKGAYTVWGRMHEERKRNLGYRVDYILLAEPPQASAEDTSVSDRGAYNEGNKQSQVRRFSSYYRAICPYKLLQSFRSCLASQDKHRLQIQQLMKCCADMRGIPKLKMRACSGHSKIEWQLAHPEDLP